MLISIFFQQISVKYSRFKKQYRKHDSENNIFTLTLTWHFWEFRYFLTTNDIYIKSNARLITEFSLNQKNILIFIKSSSFYWTLYNIFCTIYCKLNVLNDMCYLEVQLFLISIKWKLFRFQISDLRVSDILE